MGTGHEKDGYFSQTLKPFFMWRLYSLETHGRMMGTWHRQVKGLLPVLSELSDKKRTRKHSLHTAHHGTGHGASWTYGPLCLFRCIDNQSMVTEVERRYANKHVLIKTCDELQESLSPSSNYYEVDCIAARLEWTPDAASEAAAAVRLGLCKQWHSSFKSGCSSEKKWNDSTQRSCSLKKTLTA